MLKIGNSILNFLIVVLRILSDLTLDSDNKQPRVFQTLLKKSLNLAPMQRSFVSLDLVSVEYMLVSAETKPIAEKKNRK